MLRPIVYNLKAEHEVEENVNNWMLSKTKNPVCVNESTQMVAFIILQDTKSPEWINSSKFWFS